MKRSTVLASFAIGSVAGLTVENIRQSFYKKRKLLIEYRSRNVDKELLERAKEIFRFGTPDPGPNLYYYRNFVLHYDQERKIPHWVSEHITKQHLKGDALRKLCRFKPDPDVPEEYSAKNADYIDSGWSRGHMAAAGNNMYSQLSMQETYSLINAVPQNLENNRRFWLRVELFVRGLTEKFDDVYIISGPVMLPSLENGQKAVHNQLIGTSDVYVPTHLFKVIVAVDTDSPPAVAAFIVPNKPIPADRRLQDFQVPLEELEQRKGVTMLPLLDRDSARDLCEVTQCKLMPVDEFEVYLLARKLRTANTVRNLDQVWTEAKGRVQPDEKLVELYWSRKTELQDLQKDLHTKSGTE